MPVLLSVLLLPLGALLLWTQPAPPQPAPHGQLPMSADPPSMPREHPTAIAENPAPEPLPDPLPAPLPAAPLYARAEQPPPLGEAPQAQRPVQRPNPPPSVWRAPSIVHTDPTQVVRSTSLAGVVEARGRRYPAQLSMRCTISDDPKRPPASPYLEVQLDVPGFMSTLLTGDFSCEGDGASGSPSLYTEIGTSKIAARNACFDGDSSGGPPARNITLGLIYEPTLVQSILDAPGDTLAVHIRTGPNAPDNLVAHFTLPAQNATALGLITPCIRLMNAARQKEIASIVVACPAVPGATLSEVDVLSGSRMRPAPTDSDNDIGYVWNLPSPEKGQAPPKRLLVCSYKTPGTATVQKKTLPIPPSATTCIGRSDNYTNEPYGNCTR